MDSLNIQRNVFLEKEEIQRLQEFQSGKFENLLKSATHNWGIVLQDDLDGDDFLVEVGTNTGTVKISNDSYALDNQLRLIYQSALDNIDVPAQDTYYWLKISYRQIRHEVGTVSVNTSGQLTGSGTLFTEVLRGQQNGKPTKIKFYNEDDFGTEIAVNNTGVYEVVSVLNDTNAILSGNFVADTNVKYVVIGAYTNGTILSTEQENGLYYFDSCLLEWIVESVSDTAPTSGYTEDEDFYLARVWWDSGTNLVSVTDKREDYWSTRIENYDTLTVAASGSYTVTDDILYITANGLNLTADINLTFPKATIKNRGSRKIVQGLGSDWNLFYVNVIDGSGGSTVLSAAGFTVGDIGVYELVSDGSTWNYLQIVEEVIG